MGEAEVKDCADAIRDFLIMCLEPITPINKIPIIRITIESSRREKADFLGDFKKVIFNKNFLRQIIFNS